MATVSIANTTANISGKTVILAERDHTITGSWTFSRSPSAPFTVAAGSAKVANLDADKLDGIDSTGFVLSNTAVGAAYGGSLTLLKANSGTDNTVAATNVDTYAVSGLTAKDALYVVWTLEQVTQDATASAALRNTTDSVNLSTLTSTLTAAVTGMGSVLVKPVQSSTKAIGTFGPSVRFGVGSGVDANLATFTTDWTGSWTLALRTGGMTAGGTIKWTWAVYKISGQ